MANNPSLLPLIAIIVAVIVVTSGAVGFLYLTHRPATNSGVPAVAVGDNVTVNYIGILGSGAEAGKVFDTSFYSVATNNASFPKTLEFGLRASAKNYTPLPVHVSGNTPSSGYTLGNLSFIQVVTGFWQGLVGMTGNSTRTLVLPPSEAYGPSNPACISTQRLSFTLPVVETLSLAAFSADFPGTMVAQGIEFPDPQYGWPVLVLSANASFATIENLPTLGMTASPAGWPIEVTGLSSTTNGTGMITLTNQLSPAQAGHVLGHVAAASGLCGSQSNGRFIVSAVNLADGTFTEDYNTEVTGQTLVFIVTITGIFPPGVVG
ncbi:MAG: FKBP-type peptidyl-prolyl cis-trans isomerase [Thermoplasmata archaeon]|nr:FKBP-type peptidyl-prolyl cis-trans isomerase [Thermoplasmata archaeon]